LGFSAHYNAAKGLTAMIEPCQDHHRLRIQGLRVDTIASVSCVGDSSTLPNRETEPNPCGGDSSMSKSLLREMLRSLTRSLSCFKTQKDPFQHQALGMALNLRPGFLDSTLADAFIAGISANAWHLAGFSPQQLRSNGYAFLLSHIQKIIKQSRYTQNQDAKAIAIFQEHLIHEAAGGDARAFVALAKNFGINRRIGPRWIKKGDLVCVLFGSGLPCILRPTRKGNFVFLGESYTHGLMTGEAIEAWDCGKLTAEFFNLA
jgi:hypothetical protein